MNNRGLIRSAHSMAQDARQAVKEFHAGVFQPEMDLVVFFCSSRYDLDALAEEMNSRFPGVQVIGCTTAGEIGPGGYCDHSLSGMSFPAASFATVTGMLGNLQQFDICSGQSFVQNLLQRLEAVSLHADPGNSFSFLMVDGLSVREEPVARTLQKALGKTQLIGGSAGDGVNFGKTWVFHDGTFHNDSAVLALINSPFRIKTFKTQHFVGLDERLIVTEADPAQRIVKEINGRPAAEEYARLIGVPVADLDVTRFAISPVVVVIDGTDYVRSIQKANPDGSLTFFCAIEEGIVFRVARGDELMKSTKETFSVVQKEIGPCQAVLVCDCVLRHLEIRENGLTTEVGEIFRQNKAVGFSTYGEQFGGIHVNQTMTGIAIGAEKSGDD